MIALQVLVGTAGSGRDHQQRLLGGVERIPWTAGKNNGVGRHHARRPQSAEFIHPVRQQRHLFVEIRYAIAHFDAGERVANRRVRVRAFRGIRHQHRHQRGQGRGRAEQIHLRIEFAVGVLPADQRSTPLPD